MKTLNFKVLISILSLFVLIAGVVFYVKARENRVETEKEAVVSAMTTQFWYYNEGLPTEASSYSDEPVADCDTGEDVICQISAPADPFSTTPKPLMTQEVLDDIEDALDGSPSTNATVLSFRMD